MTSQSFPSKKQIATLGQLIVLVFVTTVFFRLRILESSQHIEDFHTIAALSDFSTLPIHNVLVSQYDSSTEFHQALDLTLQENFITWLNQNKKNEDESRRQIRQSMTNWLNEYGLTEDALADLSGKGFSGIYPFLFFRSSLQPFDSPLKNEAGIVSNPPIGLLLEEIQHLSMPITFFVATEFQDSTLPKLDFELNQNQWDAEGYGLTSIFLTENGTLHATFVENTRVQQQISSDIQIIEIPVINHTIEDVDLLSLLTEDQPYTRIEALLSDQTAYERFFAIYGRLRLTNAEQISGQQMLESYQTVDMLGFKFSPKHFWLFVFVFNIVFLLSSIIHILSPIARDEEEPMTFGFNVLLENRLVRVVLWCILPAVSMLIAYPQQPLSLIVRVFFWVASIGLVALGITVYLFLEQKSE